MGFWADFSLTNDKIQGWYYKIYKKLKKALDIDMIKDYFSTEWSVLKKGGCHEIFY